MGYANGRIPRSALGPITRAASGHVVYLRKDAALAFLAMNAEAMRRYGVTLRVMGGLSAYRDINGQWYLWYNVPHAQDPNWVARPGTSNHGWGIAVDLSSPRMRQILDAIGAKYGWSKAWSDAKQEWWHIRFDPNRVSAHIPKPFRALRHRSTGSRVKWVQKRLRGKGFHSVKVNGYFGEATLSAVRRFQRAHRLKADGVVGRQTWRELGK